MRIVGGEFRGRALASPADDTIRPTSDRLRETLFDILVHRFDLPAAETRVLDLFAGTGALGLEALSRGAAFTLFVEEAGDARALIRRNVEALALTGRTKVFRRDATRLGDAGASGRFGLVFADPPYRRGLGEAALAAARDGGWLAADALCLLEEDEAADIAIPAGFTLEDRRRSGHSQLLILRHGGSSDG